jgi:glycosyltransferase involved in cell wall biosynthesis
VKDERIVIDGLTVDVTDIMGRSTAIRAKSAKGELRIEFGLSADQTVFIYVGRLETYKGIECLLGAFDTVCRAHPEAALLIVGDGRERGRVKAAARDCTAIHYAGRLDYEHVVRAYNCADVAVVPSEFEPWGLVVNEAMATGLPVIASDRVGCVDDLVRNGETGLVFRSGSAEALGDSMIQLLRAPQLRDAMGAAARSLIAGWTLERQARTIVAAWEL